METDTIILDKSNINEPGNFDRHVKILVKPPAEIDLSDNKKDIAHMFFGINDEHYELRECIHNIQKSQNGLQEHSVNLIEELGDLLFYCVGLRQALFTPIAKMQTNELAYEDYVEAYEFLRSNHIKAHGVLGNSYANLSIPGLSVGQTLGLIFSRIEHVMPVFSESIKRYSIYGEEATKEKEGKPSIFHVKQMLDICACVEAQIHVIAATVSLPLEVIRIENFKKLKKRYPEGYNNQAAHERADKDDQPALPEAEEAPADEADQKVVAINEG